MTKSVLESGSIFHVSDFYLEHLAEKRFPEECYERSALLHAATAAGQIWALQYHLNCVHTGLARLAAIGKPGEADNVGLTKSLSKFPLDVLAHDWMKETVEEAPAMLSTWCSIYPILLETMRASTELRLLGERPAGKA